MFYTLIIGNLVMAALFIFRYSTLPPQIPLFYSKQVGEDQLAEWWMIFIIPILLNVFVIVNDFCSQRFFPGNAYVRRLLYYVNFALIISFTFIFLKILFLIT